MKLFEPLNVGGMTIPNRVMVPAMVTRLSGEDGLVNKDISDRYIRYAQGGAGLIVIEAMAVHTAKSGPLLRISDDRFVPGLTDLVRRIHDASDSKVVPQIIHFMKVAKSGWRQTVDMLSLAEIDRIVEEFGDAVARARAAGFDGAELHSAHAYTLASFLSRANPRMDDYGGDTLEGRLHLIGRIFENIRRKVGDDFPVGVRFLADEFIKDGYTVNDAKLIGLRLAQLGAAYLSLSVGGKFEDAIHASRAGALSLHRLFGRSLHAGRLVSGGTARAFFGGDQSLYQGAWFQHAGRDRRKNLQSRRRRAAGGDRRGRYRRHRTRSLADPDWPNKVRRGEFDRIVKCDYCNVCKHLDGTHSRVICALWPQGSLQAPPDDRSSEAPRWSAEGANLTATMGEGKAALKWNKAAGAARYDVCRTDPLGNVEIADAVKVTRWEDHGLLAGMPYRYHVCAYGAAGQGGATSNTVTVSLPMPDLAAHA